MTAYLQFEPGRTEGVICAVGSEVSGWVLMIKDDHLLYVHNALKQHYSVLRSEAPLPAGSLTVEFSFDARSRGLGTGLLLVDGQPACAPCEVRTAPLMTSPMHEGLMIGRLWGSSPAWKDCDAPFDFRGSLGHVELRIGSALVLEQVKGRAER